MDDTLSGGHTLEEALSKQIDLIKICKVGGFTLHKWKANHESLLNFPESICAKINSSNSYFDLLGLNWSVDGDYFSFDFETNKLPDTLSKRIVLANIAKFFDPLGWLAPVIITAKIFLQKLWLTKLEWDEKLSDELKSELLMWYNGTPILRNIRIPRWLYYTPGARYELYGFAYASKIAYAACIYIKVISKEKSTVHLVQAKSKVAPIKPLQTIPRLELSAAYLLTRLAVKVLRALNINNIEVFLLTDSMNVLHWLKDHPSRWPLFVAHRCSKVIHIFPMHIGIM